MGDAHPSGRRRGLALGAVIGLIGEGLVLPVGLVSAAFLTRSLGLSQYGLLGVVFAAVAPVAWVAASVLGGRAAVRLISTAERQLETAGAIIRSSLWIGLGAWAAFCAAAPLLAGWLGRPGAAGLFMFAGAEILLFPIARAHRDALTALGRYSSAGAAAAIQNLARLALVIATVTAGLRVEGVVLALILARIAEILWCRSVIAPPLSGAGGIRHARLGEMLSTSFLYALCMQLFNRIDILLLSALGGSDQAVSEFAAAQGLAMAPGLFAMVVSALMIAAITRAEAAGAPDESLRVRSRCDQIAAMAAAGAAALAGASDSVSRILFGVKFAGAAPLLTLLLVGGAGTVLLSFSTAQLLVSNRYRTLLMIGGAMVAAAVAGHLLAIPVWGAAGAAAVTAGVAAAGGITAALALPAPRSARLMRLAKAAVCGAAGFALARYLEGRTWPLIDAAAGGLAAAALMLALRIVTLADLKAFLGDLKPRGTA